MEGTMRKVKHVDLVFENCESVKLNPSMFYGLWIGGITKDYGVNCYQYKAGETCVDTVCARFCITINEKGLRAKTDIGRFSQVLRDRLLKWRDITHVNLTFDDGTEEYIGVPWTGNQDTNTAQKHKWEKKRTQVQIKIRAAR